MTGQEVIEQINVAKVQDGDMIVIKTKHLITDAGLARTKAMLRGWLDDNGLLKTKVFILDPDSDMEIVRPNSEEG